MEKNTIDKNNSDLAESGTSGSEADVGKSCYNIEEILLEADSETSLIRVDQEDSDSTDQVVHY